MTIKQKERAEAAALAATSVVGGAIVAEAIILDRRSATAEQRRVARENARQAYAQMSAERKEAMKKDGVRFLAVDTVQSKNSRGQKDVMIYDTKRGTIKSNTAYDIRVAPDIGDRVKFDTQITEYVGGDE
ncbi:MAG: hypothetical protein HKN23_13930 [Verrucomicrobiales bacterium]|nr:hypothetical protein [Verrucomicrobiales bacterium]